MSTYADRLLRTGGATSSTASGVSVTLTDAEIEIQLEKIVTLFGYIVDKDLFGEIYRQQLAKRLLLQKRYTTILPYSAMDVHCVCSCYIALQTIWNV